MNQKDINLEDSDGVVGGNGMYKSIPDGFGDTKAIHTEPNGIIKDDAEKSKKKGKKEKKKEKKDKDLPAVPPVSYFALFRYTTTLDNFLLFLGLASAAIAGCCTPAMVILFGNITDTMVQSGTDVSEICDKYNVTMPGDPEPVTISPEDMLDKLVDDVGKFALYMLFLGIGTLLLIYTFITCFNTVSENQVHRVRKLYLQALLRQNVAWYDTVTDKNFVSRIAEDLMKIQEATGEKLGLCIFFMAVSLLSLGTAFYHGWKLTLVVLSSAPVLALATGIVASIQSKLTTDEQGSYAKAGKVVEEAITNIRTVKAFGGQNKEIARYSEGLSIAESAGKKRGLISGVGVGLMWFIIYASYALAFWYGTKLIIDDRPKYCKGEDVEYGADNLLIVFFSVLMGAFNIGQSASYFEAFANGRGAAGGIYNVIDRVPEIDSYSDAGKKPDTKPRGLIEFKDVHFSYPSRVDVQVMKGFNLTIQPGQTVALVGHSGCGKSTALQLLQRFYDPVKGKISLDDQGITDLNIGWLRSQIGVVSQEPVLFNTTIRANIQYGREGVSHEEIEEACRLSNAHAFISKLPNGYDTLVGDRGAQLSGGQKQRVAIARALVRRPVILLLDEATSALDTQSESIVQAALDNARIGRTTLIVAHRLSTIRAADMIVSINNGQVEEIGTHAELLERKGLYYQLVTTQMHARESEENSDEDEETDVAGGKEKLERKVSFLRSRSKSIPEDEEIMPYIPALSEDSLDEAELAKEAPVRRLLGYNMPEIKYIIMGTLMAIVQGCILPFYALIFGEYLLALSKSDEKAREMSDFLAILFLGIGILAGVSQFIQVFAFTFSGEALTLRLRKLSFAAMLNQEMGWFDDPSRSIGALCSRLSGDAASVNGATGSRIGSLVQAVATIVGCCAMAMYQLPKLAAVALAFVPIVLFATYFEGKFMTGQNIGEKKAVEDGSKLAVEAVSNIRTVASLCKERVFVQMYEDRLTDTHRINMKKAHIRGLVFGIAQSIPLFAYACVMYYGTILIKNDDQSYDKVFKVAEALIFGTMMVGQTMAFAPNYNKAKVSGARIVKLLDRQPTIDLSPNCGKQIKQVDGRVSFEGIGFHYPTRPTAPILRNLSFAVQPGKSVAIVGPSGSGKSTCIQLILRFYDPISGSVKLDKDNIKDLNVNSMLSHMAIVAQEPALFDLTLRENIAYGDNTRELSMDEIIKAARMANIHSFISSLPAGYETRVGDLGSQLSGGQKQRVAIARALIRNPKLLLLDEATSALDTESEMVVQAALETASSGRTSITIAHRLSSIQNSDCILVISNGKLTESGTHNELLQKGGLYHKLWNMQGSAAGKDKDKDA